MFKVSSEGLRLINELMKKYFISMKYGNVTLFCLKFKNYREREFFGKCFVLNSGNVFLREKRRGIFCLSLL
jgi:hypothetical protein